MLLCVPSALRLLGIMSKIFSSLYKPHRNSLCGVPEPGHVIRKFPLQRLLFLSQFLVTDLECEFVAARILPTKPSRHEECEKESHAKILVSHFTQCATKCKTHLTKPIKMLCPVIKRGPSRVTYTYDAIIPPQLPPITCIAIPVPRFKLPPIFPLFQAIPSGICG